MSLTGNATTTCNATELDGDMYQYGLIIVGKAVGPVAETAFLTLYTGVFSFAIYSVVQRGLHTLTSRIMLGVLIQLYLTSFTLWALNTSDFFRFLHNLFFGAYPPGTALLDRLDDAHASTGNTGPAEEALFLLNMLVGDSVVIWRVWVIHQRSRLAVAVPITLILLCLGFAITDLICLTSAGFSSETTISSGGAVCANAELIAWSLSLGTNAVCTGLIWVKAWGHRRIMRAAGSTRADRHGSSGFTVDRTLSLLVESGFVYCLIWLTQIVLFVPTNYGTAGIYFFFVLGGLGDQLSGMYPTLIILVVNFKRSLWASRDAANGLGGSVSLELEFPSTTVGTVRTSRGMELGSRRGVQAGDGTDHGAKRSGELRWRRDGDGDAALDDGDGAASIRSQTKPPDGTPPELGEGRTPPIDIELVRSESYAYGLLE
ncbi:hypothetical protein HMN09_00914000 [Mycena chlorophos]|uniref:Uncharacterized protein n=1 Tax=Mycena chlorophos TaxID=658473 RepID=A0A8H6SK34_MYCCL|nr:hypothetical protein HMN09_00914000 [Mycena chlorophos]